MKVRDTASAGAASGVKARSGGSAPTGSWHAVPPGHAGRGWSELPPGLRKKVPQPVEPAPVAASATPAATSTAQGAASTKPVSSPATPKPQQPAVSEAEMERYLAELNAGRADRAKEPTGFMAWVRTQLTRESQA